MTGVYKYIAVNFPQLKVVNDRSPGSRQRSVRKACSQLSARNRGRRRLHRVGGAVVYGRFDFHLLRHRVTPSRNEPPKLAGQGIGHAVQFGLSKISGYIRTTRAFVTTAVNNGYQAKLEADDAFDTIRTYDASSNTFASFYVNKETQAITPRTMFKPDDLQKYFDDQIGKSVDLKKYFHISK